MNLPAPLLLLVLCTACAEAAPRVDRDSPPAVAGPPLRVALQASRPGMQQLSPLSYRGGFQPKTLLYETLVRRDDEGRIVPGLAEGWRFEEAGRIVIFTLPEFAFFHDGARVDAEAVRMHFKRWVGLPEHAWLGANQHIVDVAARSERELRIELDEPYALLADLCAINPCAIRGPGALDATGEFVRPVGSGPFRFLEEGEDGRTFRLERTHPVGGSAPTGRFVDLVAFGAAGERSSFEALLRGDVDVLVDGWYEAIPRPRIAELVADPGFDVFEGPGSAVWYLSFRLQGFTADLHLRRRVAAAVDRAALIQEVEFGHADACYAWAAPTVGIWPRGNPTAEPTNNARPVPLLEFIANEAAPREAALAEALVDQIRRRSGPIELHLLDAQEYGRAVERGAYDLRLESTWGVPYDPLLSLKARFLPPPEAPSAAQNRFYGVDPRLTALVEEASRIPDVDGRREVFARFQSLMEREALLVPLLVPRRVGVVRRETGARSIPLDHDLYRTRFEDLFAFGADARRDGVPSALDLSPDGREAFQRLLAAKRFTDDAIYDGGVTPNEVIALRHLWREPQAAAAFASLERNATLPGRLYALCGLYYTDRALFEERIEAYRGSEETVFFQTGCTGITDQPVRELVERADDGVVRLRGDETIQAWLAARDNPDGSAGGYGYDILGGGWPNLFRDGGGWHEVREEGYSEHAD